MIRNIFKFFALYCNNEETPSIKNFAPVVAIEILKQCPENGDIYNKFNWPLYVRKDGSSINKIILNETQDSIEVRATKVPDAADITEDDFHYAAVELLRRYFYLHPDAAICDNTEESDFSAYKIDTLVKYMMIFLDEINQTQILEEDDVEKLSYSVYESSVIFYNDNIEYRWAFKTEFYDEETYKKGMFLHMIENCIKEYI